MVEPVRTLNDLKCDIGVACAFGARACAAFRNLIEQLGDRRHRKVDQQ
jgi:hypothetical protein